MAGPGSQKNKVSQWVHAYNRLDVAFFGLGQSSLLQQKITRYKNYLIELNVPTTALQAHKAGRRAGLSARQKHRVKKGQYTLFLLSLRPVITEF